MLGDFDLDILVSANPVLGPFLFILYIFLVFFVMLSMFLSVVDQSYNSVREKLEEQGDEREPLEQDVLRFFHEVLSVWQSVSNFIASIICGGSSKRNRKDMASNQIAEGNKEMDRIESNLEKKTSANSVMVSENSSHLQSHKNEGVVEQRYPKTVAASLEARKRQKELLEDAAPVTDALTGAFSQLGHMNSTTKDMLTILESIDDVIMKREMKMKKKIQEQESTTRLDSSLIMGI